MDVSLWAGWAGGGSEQGSLEDSEARAKVPPPHAPAFSRVSQTLAFPQRQHSYSPGPSCPHRSWIPAPGFWIEGFPTVSSAHHGRETLGMCEPAPPRPEEPTPADLIPCQPFDLTRLLAYLQPAGIPGCSSGRPGTHRPQDICT